MCKEMGNGTGTEMKMGFALSTFSLLMLVLGVTIITANGFLIYSIIQSRKSLNWKRYACRLNLTISDLLCGFVLILSVVGYYNSCIEFLQTVMGLEMCMNVKLTIFNYGLAVGIQYMALQNPLYYATQFRVKIIVRIIIVIWVTVVLYSVVKNFVTCHFSIAYHMVFVSIDFMAVGVSLAINSFFYWKVYTIVMANKKQHYQCRCSSSDILTSEDKCPSTKFDYQPVITLGVQLATYIATGVPMLLFLLFIFVNLLDGINSSPSTSEPIVFVWWFVRAAVDPVIFLVQEKRLMQNRKKSLSANSNSSSVDSQEGDQVVCIKYCCF